MLNTATSRNAAALRQASSRRARLYGRWIFVVVA